MCLMWTMNAMSKKQRIDAKNGNWIRRENRAKKSPNNKPLSFPADVWSVGCIAAEMLIGHPLFPGESTNQQVSIANHFARQTQT